jgi:hypothetical protein
MITSKKLHDLKDKVEKILRDYPETRNCDVLLTNKLIELYFPQFYFLDSSGEIWINQRAKMAVREISVVRVRTMIQNEDGKYLPSDSRVRRVRRISEERYRRFAQDSRAYAFDVFNRDKREKVVKRESVNQSLF